MNSVILTNSLPVRTHQQIYELCAWNDDKRHTKHQTLQVLRNVYPQQRQRTIVSFLYPTTGQTNRLADANRERSFTLSAQTSRKPTTNRRNTSPNVRFTRKNFDRTRQLTIQPDSHNIQTLESEISCWSLSSSFPSTPRQGNLELPKKKINIKQAHSKPKISLANVDEYLTDYDTRGRLSQRFFDNYYVGPWQKRISEDGKLLRNMKPKFSRRDWRHRRDMEFYII